MRKAARKIAVGAATALANLEKSKTGNTRRGRKQLASSMASEVEFPSVAPSGLAKVVQGFHMDASRYGRTAGNYAYAVSGNLARQVSEGYIRMLLQPFEPDLAQRYPDTVIVPTALVNLRAQSTRAAPAIDPANPWFAALFVKTSRWPPTGFSAGDPHDSTAPTIAFPGAITGITDGLPPALCNWGNYDGAGLNTPASQAQWQALSATDRTLACAIRVKPEALAPGNFSYGGTFYFLEVQQDEFLALQASLNTNGGEDVCIQMVTARKGFSITTDDMAKVGGVTHPFLPTGPNCFNMSDTSKKPNGLLLDFSAPATSGFASFSFLTDDTGHILRTPNPPAVFSSPPILVAVGYGVNPNSILRFDYGHMIEYIPTAAASGLLDTKSCPPSSQAVDLTLRNVQTVQSELYNSNVGQIATLVGGTGSIASHVGQGKAAAKASSEAGQLIGRLSGGKSLRNLGSALGITSLR